MKNNIIGFDVTVAKCEIPPLKYCIVKPSIGYEDDRDRINRISEIFKNYHLAIKPNIPVILFELEDNADVGSILYRYVDGHELYHIPESKYKSLEDIVSNKPFWATHDILLHIIGNDNAFGSIFSFIPEYWMEQGLNVVGLVNNSKELS